MCDSKQQGKTMLDEWTDEDVKRAARDGWVLALHSDGSEIQRLDDPASLAEVVGVVKPIFDSDMEATGHVLQVAMTGKSDASPCKSIRRHAEAKQHAQKTLRILRDRQKDTPESPPTRPGKMRFTQDGRPICYKYTVDGVYEDNGQAFTEVVGAMGPRDACILTQERHPDLHVISVFPGEHTPCQLDLDTNPRFTVDEVGECGTTGREQGVVIGPGGSGYGRFFLEDARKVAAALNGGEPMPEDAVFIDEYGTPVAALDPHWSPQMTDAEYLMADTLVCPFCREETLARSGNMTPVSNTQQEEDVTCEACGREFKDLWECVGYTE